MIRWKFHKDFMKIDNYNILIDAYKLKKQIKRRMCLIYNDVDFNYFKLVVVNSCDDYLYNLEMLDD